MTFLQGLLLSWGWAWYWSTCFACRKIFLLSLCVYRPSSYCTLSVTLRACRAHWMSVSLTTSSSSTVSSWWDLAPQVVLPISAVFNIGLQILCVCVCVCICVCQSVCACVAYMRQKRRTCLDHDIQSRGSERWNLSWKVYLHETHRVLNWKVFTAAHLFVRLFPVTLVWKHALRLLRPVCFGYHDQGRFSFFALYMLHRHRQTT